ncbi:hypothetical protein M5K25_013059 [Dendrobium thyrsiflorum]|uniref:DUF4743 domain-containing protein n=1 Tax=Dendrobium thyrsiflorum TaxID=117978 RepID=A0ABD0UYU5_DENTH
MPQDPPKPKNTSANVDYNILSYLRKLPALLSIYDALIMKNCYFRRMISAGNNINSTVKNAYRRISVEKPYDGNSRVGTLVASVSPLAAAFAYANQLRAEVVVEHMVDMDMDMDMDMEEGHHKKVGVGSRGKKEYSASHRVKESVGLLFPVTSSFGKQILFSLERAAAPYFGIKEHRLNVTIKVPFAPPTIQCHHSTVPKPTTVPAFHCAEPSYRNSALCRGVAGVTGETTGGTPGAADPTIDCIFSIICIIIFIICNCIIFPDITFMASIPTGVGSTLGALPPTGATLSGSSEILIGCDD